ncbi:MAG TPA: GNAT family N-acetyltransferase [Solirubrobacteraceae bacterium]|nr:GNAT family N-acetyltransferase [Solirubrobacteraceae bacterium]
MGEIVPIKPDAEAEWENGWRVRQAAHSDVAAVALAVSELLLELGGKPAPIAALEVPVRALIDDRGAGLVLVAESEADGEIIGVLGVSWQIAIRIPGRYGLIQELWVDPAWRYRTIGGDLVEALCVLASRHGIGRIEVGLPGERFPHHAATESFYANNGFSAIGLRMKRLCR